MPDWNQQIIDEFRANDGTVETMGFGRGLVLVHHRGAKTGTERVTPLAALPTDDGAWLIAASKAGAPDNPDWYHNLRAYPEVTVEAPGEGVIEVRARVLESDERDAAWARFTAASEGFRSYQEKTTRVIPVVELSRR
ncbi:MAG: nitroreductase family deazaflavin-dependent oxidoreductase [Actinomycetota bacterium]|nr:nitroreductase family deazaflavin-dependent oxidoreductase [Actinomycetota bacterium]